MAGALVRKYARSLVDVALERGVREKVQQDLDGFTSLYRQNQELRGTLENPAIPASAKRSVIREIARRTEICQEVVNFLSLLVQNNRIQLLAEMRAAFQEALNERLGVLGGSVYSPVPLLEGQKQRIQQQLAQVTGQRVDLEYHLDPNLIGGVKIQLGGVIYDASVKKQLEEIRRRIG